MSPRGQDRGGGGRVRPPQGTHKFPCGILLYWPLCQRPEPLLALLPIGLLPALLWVAAEARLGAEPAPGSGPVDGLGGPGDTWNAALPGQPAISAVVQGHADLQRLFPGLFPGEQPW